MAFLLTGERPAEAAVPESPLSGFAHWLGKARVAHQQRVALATLLQMDDHRLDDLGISRQDVVEALAASAAPGNQLAIRRAGRATAWLRSL